MSAARITAQNRQLDSILENSFVRPASVRPPTKSLRKPFALSVREWAGSQVAAYRVGLVLGYIAMMFFGGSAFYAGIPTFSFTTPNGYTPIWATVVFFGGLVAAIGAIRAGAEPVTPDVKIFNRIELTGAIMLFLSLGTYAAILLYVGYVYSDGGRQTSGSGFLALGVPAAVRMVWLIFRPRFLQLSPRLHARTGPVPLVIPDGFALVRIDENGLVIPETAEQIAARLGLEGK